jgi:hypothetical protein
MPHIQDLEKMDVEEALKILNNIPDGPTSRPFETARTAVQVKSISALMKSIDEFRKSNERTSNALVRLTWVLVFAACVQAFYAIMLLLKK